MVVVPDFFLWMAVSIVVGGGGWTKITASKSASRFMRRHSVNRLSAQIYRFVMRKLQLNGQLQTDI